MSMSNIEAESQGPTERGLDQEEPERFVFADVRWQRDSVDPADGKVRVRAFIGDEGDRQMRVTLTKRAALELAGELISAALVAEDDDCHY